MSQYSSMLFWSITAIRAFAIIWIQQIAGKNFIISQWNLQFGFIILVSICTAFYLFRKTTEIKKLIFTELDLFLVITALYPIQNLTFILFVLFSHYILAVKMLNKPGIFIHCILIILFSIIISGERMVSGTKLSGLSLQFRILLILCQVFYFWLISRFNKIGLRSDTAGKDRLLYEQNMANLLEINLDLQNYAIREAEKSKLQERKRIAQELHDDLMHSLLTLKMAGESMHDHIPNDNKELQDLLKLSETIINGIWENIEAEIYSIKNREENKRKGLNRINDMITMFREATQINVQVEYGNFPSSLGNQIDRILYRIIQEGLTNAFRHGKADYILVLLWQESGQLRLVIRDNGIGDSSNNSDSGMGLWGIRQRLATVNGNACFSSGPDGFEISVSIPWEGV